MTMPQPESSAPSAPRPPRRSRRLRGVIVGACVVVAAAAVVTVGVKRVAKPIAPVQSTTASTPPIGTYSHHPVVISLPAHAASYLGAFVKGIPGSYAPMKSFAHATGVHPNVALYYSGWYEKFQSAFANQAKANGAVPFIQIDPTGIQFKAIVRGVYDTYLDTIATDIASYGARTSQGVIIGFGHEMNGRWFPWGYRHVAPDLFVAAWRHIVNVFRQQGADDVTWLWTVNIIDTRNNIPSPAPWWPGSSYVTWIGIDGYYLRPSWSFASLFGPTIKVVKALTLDPILISETGASPAVGQPAKIDDLFAGVRAYGLLGFVWFDGKGTQDWALSSAASFAAFRKGAKTFSEPTS
jgi:mannan endo-1,4-beta-mannosidase